MPSERPSVRDQTEARDAADTYPGQAASRATNGIGRAQQRMRVYRNRSLFCGSNASWTKYLTVAVPTSTIDRYLLFDELFIFSFRTHIKKVLHIQLFISVDSRPYLIFCLDLSLTTAWTVRGWNPGRDEIFRTCPDRPCGPPSLLYNGYRVFPVGKAAGAWH
jgi:hypothetical protein